TGGDVEGGVRVVDAADAVGVVARDVGQVPAGLGRLGRDVGAVDNGLRDGAVVGRDRPARVAREVECARAADHHLLDDDRGLLDVRERAGDGLTGLEADRLDRAVVVAGCRVQVPTGLGQL